MKKKSVLKQVQGHLSPHSKILRVMRLTLFFLFVSLVQVFAVNTYSQSARLSLNLKNTTIKNVLFDIENKSEFYFLFNSK